MNIIRQLLDEEFVKQFFTRELLPLLPEFKSIESVEIKPIKDHIWHTTYHVVFRIRTAFTRQDGKQESWPIFCTAHSSEPRKNALEALNHLWNSSFSTDPNFTVPKPLFYSEYFRAVFYRGLDGQLLYHYIKEKDFTEIEANLIRTAGWFAKLHRLPASKAKNFNPENSRINTVLPGREHVLAQTEERYPELLPIYAKLYEYFVSHEETFLNSTEQRWLVHGDAHPENVIKVHGSQIGVVDFADFCLSDFARDLGTFLQQLDYMSNRKIEDPVYTEKIKQLFLAAYLDQAGIELDSSLAERIRTYYNWTTIRTANYFLFKHDPQPDRAMPLIEAVCKELGF